MKSDTAWSQASLAKELNVALRTYKGWENGEAIPSPEYVQQIVALLNLNKEDEDALYRTAQQVPPIIDNLPFQRNPFFTGREEHLKQIHKQLQEKGIATVGPVSVSGLSGIGKTELALEYAHRYYPNVYRAVLWVDADMATIESSYANLAEILKLPERNEQKINRRILAVKEWLKAHTNWLIIMDNADDLSLAESLLPAKPLGHVVFTTQSQIIGTTTTGDRQIEIEAMGSNDGLRLLLRRSHKLEDDAPLDTIDADVREAALQVVELLGGHPLALDQAGAYIEGTRISFAEYEKRLRKERRRLLNMRKPLKGKASERGRHPLPVAAALELCIKEAGEQHPLTTDILNFCSFLQPDDIPEELFQHNNSFNFDTSEFDEAIAALHTYSLIKRNRWVNKLSMHRLVQAVLIDNMLPDMQKHWRARVVQALNAAFPEYVGTMEWEQFHRLLPQVKFCATWAEDELTQIPEAAILFHRTSIPLLVHEFAFSEAETLLARAIPIYKRHVGVADPLLKALQKLADLYHWRGKNGKAEHLYRQIAIIWEQIAGPEHLETARSLHNLLAFYLDVGQRDVAEAMLAGILSLQAPILKPHPVSEYNEYTRSLHKLIFSYITEYSLESFKVDYGVATDYELIEQLLDLMISVQKKYLGVEHPETARSLRLLAQLHEDVDYEQAEALYRQALTGFEKHLDAGDIDTALTTISLADLLHDHGRHEEADALWQQVLHTQEEEFEAAAPFLKDVKKWYARFLRSLGRDAEAAAQEANDELSE